MTLDLAIVVPVGPDDETWHELLPQIAQLDVREIVMVFASEASAESARRAIQSSRDDAKNAPIRFLAAERGRACQLNAGAEVTRAGWLWFLHADSILAAGSAAALTCHIKRNWNALGYFDLRFLADGPALMAINSFGTWWRSRLFGLPFGDQGFVLSRRLFDQLHGFDATVTYGEDHDLVWRARASGARLQPVGATLYTSARKYARNGWRRTTGEHLRLTWQQARLFSRRAGT